MQLANSFEIFTSDLLIMKRPSKQMLLPYNNAGISFKPDLDPQIFFLIHYPTRDLLLIAISCILITDQPYSHQQRNNYYKAQ